MYKAVFLDRDGVINRKALTEDEYVTGWEELEILPGVPEAISRLNRTGFRVIVVTNQRAVSKGLITAAELESLHQTMCAHLISQGARIDAVYYCPHELEPPCSCRKPQPGMLVEAARIHNLDMTRSWMIGDSDKDVEAGRRAGCRTIQLIPAHRQGKSSSADLVAPSLLDATHKILTTHAHTDE